MNRLPSMNDALPPISSSPDGDAPSLGLDLGPAPVRKESAGEYRVLARKYRPSSFEDLIGQEAMVRTLTNAFKLDRIHQAYILTGVRGVGKTTTARILARASLGAIQVLLGPASSGFVVHTKVRCSTRATSEGCERARKQFG